MRSTIERHHLGGTQKLLPASRAYSSPDRPGQPRRGPDSCAPRLAGECPIKEDFMPEHIQIDDAAIADIASGRATQTIIDDIAYQRLAIVNVVYVGLPGSADWVLVDTGIPGSTGFIERAIEERFGEDARPRAIVMTHGHFDHVGALEELASKWDIPVYAHKAELPYLDGANSYPPPDPTVGGGLMSALSRFYPRGPVDVGQWLRPLPANASVPPLPGWQWIPTPGHTAGHISLWRESDRSLIAGDAFITTNQESAYAVATQDLEIQGPPMYFTPDWASAKISVHRLRELEPNFAVTGHGRAIHGPELREGLQLLDDHFDEVAVPEHGRYVHDGRPPTTPLDDPLRAGAALLWEQPLWFLGRRVRTRHLSPMIPPAGLKSPSKCANICS